MITVKRRLTDSQRDAIYELLKHECSVPYISHKFGCSVKTIYNIWHVGEAFESRNLEKIKAYKNSTNYTAANLNWAKAKFGPVSMFEDEVEPEEYGSATAIEVMINQQRDMLIELVRIRKLLEEG